VEKITSLEDSGRRSGLMDESVEDLMNKRRYITHKLKEVTRIFYPNE